MYKPEDFTHVFEQLKLQSNRAVSLYKYAPVFKVRVNDKFFVLKKTKKDEMHANKMRVFERHLDSVGIKVTTPLKRFDQETHMIDDERWVLYPFVEGNPYNASVDHIKLAGDLLGKIHSSNNHVFNHGFTWKTYEDVFFTDILDDLKTIESKYGEQDALRTQIEGSIINKLENIKSLELPYVDASWDYKASNLIYDDSINLIDLDNSGYIPRIFDLALTLLLFHSDAALAPDRPFTVDEWHLFMEAYLTHVKLEPVEIENFTEFLKFVFLDEGLYAIIDLEDDEPERQKNFMINLLKIDFSQYKI